MNRMGQIASIALMLALSCLIIGWANSYPVSLRAADDSNLAHISWFFWIGLFSAYPALFFVGINSKPGVRAFCLIIFMLLFSAHKLLYLQTGSDTEVFIGLLDRFNDTGLLDSDDKTYYQWPIMTIWGFLLQQLFSATSAEAYTLFWVVLIIGYGISGYIIFRKEESDLPYDFLGCTLYLMALFWFWDWQVSAYNWSLILVFSILSLLKINGWPFRFFIMTAFLLLTFSHGMLSVWILGIVPTTMALEWLVTKKRPGWSTLVVTFVIIQITVLLFHALRLTRHIVLTFSNYLTSILEQELSSSTLNAYAAGAATPPANFFDMVTKWLAWGNLGLLFLLLGIGFIVPIWRRDFNLRDWSIAGVGVGHFALGNVLPLLGIRAFNIMFILPSRGIAAAMEVQRLRVPVMLLFLIALLLFPVNQIRTQLNNPQYNTVQNLDAARFLSDIVERRYELGTATTDADAKVRSTQTSVLADQAQLYYITSALPQETIRTINPRLSLPESVKDAEFTVINAQLEHELWKRLWPDKQTILQESETVRFDRIYDSGTNVIFQQQNSNSIMDVVSKAEETGL